MSIKKWQKNEKKTWKIDFIYCNQSSFSNIKFDKKTRIHCKNDIKKVGVKTKKKRENLISYSIINQLFQKWDSTALY